MKKIIPNMAAAAYRSVEPIPALPSPTSPPPSSGSSMSALRLLGPAFLWILAFTIVIGVLHIGALEQEVIDWDESAFILGAADLQRGHLPYVETFEHKPPAIFFMLADQLLGWFVNLILQIGR